MNIVIKTIAAAALIASFAAPSYAAIQQDVTAAAGSSSNISVKVSGDTVTLTGYVQDSYSRQRAERVAKNEGFQVRNYLLLSN